MPMISVVIATYRRPQALARAIESAIAQSFVDIEVVVALERDDPESREVVERNGDARVRYVVNPIKRGPGVARDMAVDASAGRWIAFLDDDDEWSAEKLQRQLEATDGDERTIVSCLSRVVSPAGITIRPTRPYEGTQSIDEWLFDRQSWFGGGEAMLQTSSLVLPKALFNLVRFGTSRHEEWELVIRAVKQHGYRLITVREPLVTYHAGNSYPWRKSVEWAESVRDLLSARAYAGFYLTAAGQGLKVERNRALASFLGHALRKGRPTARQLFAFFMIWLVPDPLRNWLRIKFGSASAGKA